MGGDDSVENIVLLTAEEHYVAHQLLVKIHPEIPGLATAAVRMSRQCTGNKAYGWLRRRHAQFMRQQKYTLGKIFTAEHRANLSAAQKGKKQSAETRSKRAVALRGRKVSEETRKKISAANTGKAIGIKRPPRSAEHRAKLSAAGLRRTFDPIPQERKTRISASMKAYWARQAAANG